MIKRFPELIDRELNVEEFINLTEQKMDEFPKVKIYTTIMNSIGRIRLNHKLMQLRDSDISGHAKLNIINKIQEEVCLNKKLFLDLFFEDGLNSFIKDPHSCLHNSFNRLEIYGKS